MKQRKINKKYGWRNLKRIRRVNLIENLKTTEASPGFSKLSPDEEKIDTARLEEKLKDSGPKMMF